MREDHKVMDNHEDIKRMKEEYETYEAPKELRDMVEHSIQKAEKEKGRTRVFHMVRGVAATVAAAMIILTILVNTNQTVAMAMSNIPVLGSIVNAVTFRDYRDKGENHEANVKVPGVVIDEQEAADHPASEELQNTVEKINTDIEAYTNEMIEKYKNDILSDGGIHEGLDIDYEVLRDDDQLYILRLWAVETMASGAQTEKYYLLNKQTGKEVKLADLFQENTDYVGVISENIKEQMREQMKNEEEGKAYFLEDPNLPEEEQFTKIKPDQNFYINQDNKLVVVFDEYEVAPGYMGMCYFEIPTEVLTSILHENTLIK